MNDDDFLPRGWFWSAPCKSDGLVRELEQRMGWPYSHWDGVPRILRALVLDAAELLDPLSPEDELHWRDAAPAGFEPWMLFDDDARSEIERLGYWL